MANDLIDCGLAVLLLVILMFILDRLGLIAWFSWMSRRRNSTRNSPAKHGSSSRKYWSMHE